MKCIIPANHVKIFAKAVHSLSKLGSEINLVFSKDRLEVKTVKACRSAFASIVFQKSFFDEYVISFERQDGNSDFLKCRLSVKTILQVFRSMSSIERSVEACEISLSSDECLLIFVLKCRHAVVKRYQLNFEECESLNAVYSKDMCPNKLSASPKLFNDVLMAFAANLEQITLSVTPCEVSLSSYDEDEDSMYSKMRLNPEEFDYFQIGVDTCISFSLRDLRAIMHFVDYLESKFKMHFEIAGKPLVLDLTKDDVLTATFVLSTLSDSSINNSIAVNASVLNTVKRKKMPNTAHSSITQKKSKSMEQYFVSKNLRKSSAEEKLASKSSTDVVDLTDDNETPANLNLPHDKPGPSNMDDSVLSLPPHMRVRCAFFAEEEESSQKKNYKVLAYDTDEET